MKKPGSAGAGVSGSQRRETPGPDSPGPGVYMVQWGSCPRRLLDTGLPAGAEAEAVARSRYRALYSLMRQDIVPALELVEA